MFANKWTQKEIDLFAQGLSDTEIVLKTGRSAYAVIQKRRRLKENQPNDELEFYRIPPCLKMTQTEKEQRIRDLAERYGVRLL